MAEEFSAGRANQHSNAGSVIRDDPYWTSTKNSLELTERPSIHKVSLV